MIVIPAILANLGKKKSEEKCTLCGRVLDESFSHLKYVTEDGQEGDYGKICKRCADVLDRPEIESEDDDG